jgi:hypothetical protein
MYNAANGWKLPAAIGETDAVIGLVWNPHSSLLCIFCVVVDR